MFKHGRALLVLTRENKDGIFCSLELCRLIYVKCIKSYTQLYSNTIGNIS